MRCIYVVERIRPRIVESSIMRKGFFDATDGRSLVSLRIPATVSSIPTDSRLVNKPSVMETPHLKPVKIAPMGVALSRSRMDMNMHD
jgi:hypothetical protein